MKNRITGYVLDSPIDGIGWATALDRILSWASHHQPRYVCICNVHSVVTARNDASFSNIIEEADMATPDGMPVVWLMRWMGFKDQERINGPDLLWRLCADASEKAVSVYFYGGSDETLRKLRLKVEAAFPKLEIAGMVSPPYRELSPEETGREIQMINDSGAGIVFVCLGCPKQERWMAANRDEINAVTIGVGAAFSYHAGTLARAPLWMQKSGLEWLFRLAAEPRRLWRRYLSTNTQFIIEALLQIIKDRRSRRGKGN